MIFVFVCIVFVDRQRESEKPSSVCIVVRGETGRSINYLENIISVDNYHEKRRGGRR